MIIIKLLFGILTICGIFLIIWAIGAAPRLLGYKSFCLVNDDIDPEVDDLFEVITSDMMNTLILLCIGGGILLVIVFALALGNSIFDALWH